ncbi:MAG: hypothetical protein ACYTBJ_00345 [Planctomycetota bacterium]|jgi:hypothetical protein
MDKQKVIDEYRRIMEFAESQLVIAHRNLCAVLEGRPNELTVSFDTVERTARTWLRLDARYRKNWPSPTTGKYDWAHEPAIK